MRERHAAAARLAEARRAQQLEAEVDGVVEEDDAADDMEEEEEEGLNEGDENMWDGMGAGEGEHA